MIGVIVLINVRKFLDVFKGVFINYRKIKYNGFGLC